MKRVNFDMVKTLGMVFNFLNYGLDSILIVTDRLTVEGVHCHNKFELGRLE